MLKVLTIVGARPQFIKAAVVSCALAAQDEITEVLVHTGQHYSEELSAIFFEELALAVPQYQLNVGSGPHGEQTAKMLAGLEPILSKQQPDCVLLYGDTNSTLAGALASAKLGLPIVHVEAGVRSFCCKQPEEINRILTDRVTDLYIVPSKNAITNLLQEGCNPEQIVFAGDVMFDAIRLFSLKSPSNNLMESLSLKSKEYYLCTIHRAENTISQQKLLAILDELSQLASGFPVIFPIHPRTQSLLTQSQQYFYKFKQINFIAPIGYLDMQQLIKAALCIITDSGGLQKEAFYHQVPCVVLRDNTEWPELIDLGWNSLLPHANITQLHQVVETIITSNKQWANPYGEGDAASKIVTAIQARFS